MQFIKPVTQILALFLSASCMVCLSNANYVGNRPGDLRLHHRTTRGADMLRCPPCEQLHCSPRKSKLKCKGGITLGICNCCPRCAKSEGESCRGKWNYLGDCDAGLECVFDDWDESASPENKRGTCRRGRSSFIFVFCKDIRTRSDIFTVSL